MTALLSLRSLHLSALGLVLLLASDASAADQWETLQTEPILVKARPRPDSGGVKEIWAEGEIKGEVTDIQDVINDTARLPKFMPYMTEARELGKPDPDGAVYMYLRLDMPVLAPRDFIHKVYMDKDSRKPWTKGVFASHWHAMPYKVPVRPGIVRLTISEGSWLVTPLPNGRAHLVYKFSADPGGMIPSFLSNMNNVKGPGETFASVEREAALRAAARPAKAADAAGRDAGATAAARPTDTAVATGASDAGQTGAGPTGGD